METTQVIGYRVVTSDGADINANGECTFDMSEPCNLSQAYGRISQYLCYYTTSPVPTVVPVTRTLTPMETASKELGTLLSDLCERHGLNLGLTSEQIERQITKELVNLAVSKR